MRVTVNALKKRSALWVMYESLVRAILVTAAGRLPTQLAVMPVCFVQHDTVRHGHVVLASQSVHEVPLFDVMLYAIFRTAHGRVALGLQTTVMGADVAENRVSRVMVSL